MGVVISAPEALNDSHCINEFECGHSVLNDWLKKQARKNQKLHGSQTFVIATENKVIGYYALAAGSVERQSVNSNLSRNMPNPIPVIVLGRLAIDCSMQGQLLGGFLLKDALLRCVNVANTIGVKAVLVHAIDDTAKRFYEAYGFKAVPNEQHTLMLSIKQIIQLI